MWWWCCNIQRQLLIQPSRIITIGGRDHCEIAQCPFKIICASGHFHMLWQWVPQINYALSDEMLSFIHCLSSRVLREGEFLLNHFLYTMHNFIGHLCFFRTSKSSHSVALLCGISVPNFFIIWVALFCTISSPAIFVSQKARSELDIT